MMYFFDKVRQQLRDVYGFKPNNETQLTFDHIPDGIYPMTIDGKYYPGITFIQQRFWLLDVKSR